MSLAGTKGEEKKGNRSKQRRNRKDKHTGAVYTYLYKMTKSANSGCDVATIAALSMIQLNRKIVSSSYPQAR